MSTRYTVSEQQTHTLDDLQFQLPASFQQVETMVSFRAPVREELKDPRMVQGILNKRINVQPNLIVHRRHASSSKSLEDWVGESCAEFVRSFVTLQNLNKRPFSFDDGQEGFLVTFDLPATSSTSLRQFHVFRVEGNEWVTLALTIDGMALNEAEEERWLKSLSTLQRKG